MNLRDPKGYYIALGIDESANADAIKSAYRSKAKRLPTACSRHYQGQEITKYQQWPTQKRCVVMSMAMQS